MISEIYKRRDPGEAINDGCQWLLRHWRLAMYLLLLPVFVCATLIFADYMLMKNEGLEIVIGMVGVMSVVMMPATMLNIVDEARLEGRRERLSDILLMGGMMAKYLLRAMMAVMLCAIVMVVGLLSVLPVPLVPLFPFFIAQMQKEGPGGILRLFVYLGNNAWAAIVMVLGYVLIVLSMSFGVGFVCLVVTYFYNNFFTAKLDPDAFALYLMGMGGAIGMEICIVTSFFFYGQCREKAESLSVMDRIENDFLPETGE